MKAKDLSRVPVIFFTSGFCAIGFAIAMLANNINGIPLAIVGIVLTLVGIITDRKVQNG